MVDLAGEHLDKLGLKHPGALLSHGTVYPRNSSSGPVPRMLDMCGALEDFMKSFRPGILVIEQHTYRSMKSIATVEALAFISTILLHRAEKHGVRVLNRMGVATIKRHASGNGGATKDTVEHGVLEYFNLSHTMIADDNHSDALGMAATWLKTGGAYKSLTTKGTKKK